MATQFATFSLDGLSFGVPVAQVQEVLRFQRTTPVPLAPSVVEGLINLRGHIVVAVDLRRRFGLRPRPAGETPMNVVVRARDGVVSLLVDTIGDVIELESVQFEAVPDTVDREAADALSGVYKLDGKLLLVIDVERTMADRDRLPHFARDASVNA
jgi:purine-binding chemotaxis protein CheW